MSARTIAGAPAPRIDDRSTRRCLLPPTREQVENRGMAWLIGAFLFCPCHLPITLMLLGGLLGGTALGVAVRSHPILSGTIITLVWAAATWRGAHLLAAARRPRGRAMSSGAPGDVGGMRGRATSESA